MRKPRFTEEQIVGIPLEVERSGTTAGQSAPRICRNAVSRRHRKNGGLQVSDADRSAIARTGGKSEPLVMRLSEDCAARWVRRWKRRDLKGWAE